MKLISIIDPGHREDTPGKRANGLEEWEFNKSISKMLGIELSKYGEVYYTIESKKHPYSELTGVGRNKNLNYRTSRANNIYWEAVKKYGKNDFKMVFISIHANAFSDPSASGYEVFVYKYGGQAHQLAKSIHRQAQLILNVGTDIKDRGIKEANFAVLKNTIMPSVLIEHEFYTNPTAAKKLLNSTFRKKCSEHIIQGIFDYTGITPIEEVEKIIYRVRKEWEDSGSQKGAYSVLENAIDEVKKHDGYKVYDDKGNQVYPEAINNKDDTSHWAYVYYQNLKDKGFNIQEMRFDDNITRGEMFKLLNEFQSRKSKYYKKGNAHVIETIAENIEIKILGNTLHNVGVFGVNGTFFDTPRPEIAKSCWGIATNEGKAIGGNSMLVSYDRNIKRGTIVCYTDETVEVVRVNSINEFKKSHKWSISGYSVYPYMNFKAEKMPSGIDYRTAHTYVGHKGNKIYLIVKPYHRINEIIPLVKELRLDGCIVLDGGGSSQLRHPEGSFKTSRKINSAVLLKEE